jgi:hypothetical protein
MREGSPIAATKAGAVSRPTPGIQAAINRLLDEHNADSKQFEWVADPDKIIAAISTTLFALLRRAIPYCTVGLFMAVPKRCSRNRCAPSA